MTQAKLHLVLELDTAGFHHNLLYYSDLDKLQDMKWKPTGRPFLGQHQFSPNKQIFDEHGMLIDSAFQDWATPDGRNAYVSVTPLPPGAHFQKPTAK